MYSKAEIESRFILPCAWLLPFQAAFTTLILKREKGCHNGNKQRSSIFVTPGIVCFCCLAGSETDTGEATECLCTWSIVSHSDSSESHSWGQELALYAEGTGFVTNRIQCEFYIHF